MSEDELKYLVDIEMAIIDIQEIIGLRNRIVHSYDSINYEHLWAIVINHLPKLKIEVDFLINKFEKNNYNN